MPSVNDSLFDVGNRHQTFLIRFGGSSAREATAILDAAEKDLVERIAQRVARLGPAAAATKGSKRLTSILDAIRQQNRDLVNALHKTTSKNLNGLAKQEVEIASKRLNESVGVDLENFRPSPEALRTLVQKRAVGGISLRRWFTRLGRDRLGRLESAVNLGVVEGDGIPDMVRRFRQAEDVSKRTAETLVRTHVNHVANQSRNALYQANSDIVEKLRWTATLDGRTSAICQARDGRTFPLDSGPRPPAHPNCRSIMTPVMKSWDELAKPGVLRPGRGAADINRLFKRNLAKQGLTPEQIRGARRNTRASMNGQVPRTQSYQQWLKRQPPEFQDEVLGPTKARLFREGNVKLTRFVDDSTGRAFTLDEIRRQNEKPWMSIISGVPQAPIKAFDTSTEVGKLHEAALGDAPAYIKDAALALKALHVIKPIKDKDGFYNPPSRGIHMGFKDSTANVRRTEGTWRHEVGHAIDHDAAAPGFKWATQSPAYQKALKKDGRALIKNNSQAGSAFFSKDLDFFDSKAATTKAKIRLIENQDKVRERLNELTIARKKVSNSVPFKDVKRVEREWFQEKFDAFGMDLADVEAALKIDDGFDTFSTSRYKLTQTLVSLERRDAGMMVNDILDWNAYYKQGNVGKVADFFGAITKNHAGYGHKIRGYYGADAGLQGMEAFSNATTFLADKNPFWATYMKHLAPGTMREAERILRSGRSKSK